MDSKEKIVRLKIQRVGKPNHRKAPLSLDNVTLMEADWPTDSVIDGLIFHFRLWTVSLSS